MPDLADQQIQGVFKKTIHTYLHRVSTWLAERRPDGLNKYLFAYKSVGRVNFQFFVRFGFDVDREKKISEKPIGLQPAEVLKVEGEVYKGYYIKTR